MPAPEPAASYSNDDAKVLMEKFNQAQRMIHKIVEIQQTLGQTINVETPEHMAEDPDNPGEHVAVGASSAPPIYLGSPISEEIQLKCYNQCRAKFHELLAELKSIEA